MSRLSMDRLFTKSITMQWLHSIKELAVYFALEMNQDVKVVDIYLGGFCSTAPPFTSLHKILYLVSYGILCHCDNFFNDTSYE